MRIYVDGNGHRYTVAPVGENHQKPWALVMDANVIVDGFTSKPQAEANLLHRAAEEKWRRSDEQDHIDS